MRGGTAASGLAAAQGAVAGGAGAAGAAELGTSPRRRPGALLGLDDRAVVLPGAVGAPGSGQGPAPAGADRCRPRAEDVAVADRGAARSIQGAPVLVGATPPRQPAGAGRSRSLSRTDAVLRHPDPGHAVAWAGAPAPPPATGAGAERPAVEAREVLSYEVSRSHALWHGDFHHGRRRVLTAAGEWRTPILLGFLDDHSRLGCHLQWYLAETAEVFVHGLCQAFMKRGLPRSLLTDNGAPMMAGEVQEGSAPARHRPCDDARLLPLPEWQAGSSMGLCRGPPDGHARGCRAALPGEAQRRDRRLGRARISPPPLIHCSAVPR